MPLNHRSTALASERLGHEAALDGLPPVVLTHGLHSPFAAAENGPLSTFPWPLGYRPGVTLCRQGEDPEDVFYLEKGLVKLLRVLPNGEERIVGLRAAGWFVAATAAILETPSVTTAMTVTWTQAARIPAARFRHLLQHDPALSKRVHRTHSQEVHVDLAQIADLSANKARERLEGLLGCLGRCEEHQGGGGAIRLPLRQWEIAQVLGISPPYLCQLLKDLQHEGVLRREGRAWIFQVDEPVRAIAPAP